jgi:single-stranded DNA-binding protein
VAARETGGRVPWLFTPSSRSGFLASEPQQSVTENGDTRFCVRIGQPHFRREDDGTFSELEPSFHDLVTYRATADRAFARFAKGDSFVAEGYVGTSPVEREGAIIEREEFVAKKIGHDLARTNYDVDRSRRPGPTVERAGPDALTSRRPAPCATTAPSSGCEPKVTDTSCRWQVSDESLGADAFDDLDGPLTPEPPHPINWNLLTAEETEIEWMELNRWVNWLRRTYGMPASVVPPFWHRHPELVWERSALPLHRLSVYDPDQHGSAPFGWHRDFADARQRLHDWVAIPAPTSTATARHVIVFVLRLSRADDPSPSSSSIRAVLQPGRHILAAVSQVLAELGGLRPRSFETPVVDGLPGQLEVLRELVDTEVVTEVLDEPCFGDVGLG